MVVDEILTVVQQYYPRGVDAALEYDKYISSDEAKRLSELKNEAFLYGSYDSRIQDFLSVYKENIYVKNILDATMSGFDRCFTFIAGDTDFFDREDCLITIKLSIIYPVYIVSIEDKLIENSKFKNVDSVNLKHDVERLIERLELVFQVKQIDQNTLKYKIPYLSYEDVDFGEFTLYNALFSSQ